MLEKKLDKWKINCGSSPLHCKKYPEFHKQYSTLRKSSLQFLVNYMFKLREKRVIVRIFRSEILNLR